MQLGKASKDHPITIHAGRQTLGARLKYASSQCGQEVKFSEEFAVFGSKEDLTTFSTHYVPSIKIRSKLVAMKFSEIEFDAKGEGVSEHIVEFASTYAHALNRKWSGFIVSNDNGTSGRGLSIRSRDLQIATFLEIGAASIGRSTDALFEITPNDKKQ